MWNPHLVAWANSPRQPQVKLWAISGLGQPRPMIGRCFLAYRSHRAFLSRAGTPVTYEDVCAKAESDPSGGGGASRCVSFGHPLELWYNTSGAGGGSYNFEFTDAQISEYVNSGRGIDESYASEGSNRSP